MAAEILGAHKGYVEAEMDGLNIGKVGVALWIYEAEQGLECVEAARG